MDCPHCWLGPAVRTRDGGFPSLCVDRTDHSSVPHCSRYTFQWPFGRNSNNSTGRTMYIPIRTKSTTSNKHSVNLIKVKCQTSAWHFLYDLAITHTKINYNYLVTMHCNPLSPNSDEDENSLYIITTCSNIQVRRIKEVITKNKM